MERVSSLPSGYGSDTGGGHTDQLLDYVTDRFGPVASFTGSYSADSWTLNIQQNTVPPGETITMEQSTKVHIWLSCGW